VTGDATRSTAEKKHLGVSPAAILLVASIMLMAAAGASWSDLLEKWYGSDPGSKAYVEVRGQLDMIFSEAARQNVPQRLLLGKLLEGEAKGVPAERLLKHLNSELARLQRAMTIVLQTGFGGSFLSPVSDETLKDIAIYLRCGLSDQLVSDLLATGAAQHVGTEAALAACGAIMDLRAVAPLEDEDSLQIGRLLMTSGMQPSGYASLALVYGLGRSRGLSHEALVHDVIINTLSSGGGLAVMNQKIESTPIAEPLPPPAPAKEAHPARPSGKRSRPR